MTIDFRCLHCGVKLSFSDDQSGQRVDCESCGRPITIPAPFAGHVTRRGLNAPLKVSLNSYNAKLGILEFCCPSCRNELQALKESAGGTMFCKECDSQLQIPPLPRGDDRERMANRSGMSSSPSPIATKSKMRQAESSSTTQDAQEHGGERSRHESEDRSCLDKLVDASPGSGELKENSGMDIDLSTLTVPGWCLAIITILVAGSAVVIPFLMFTSAGNRTSGGIARAIGIPLALVVGGATFWLGKRILSAVNLPLTRDE